MVVDALPLPVAFEAPAPNEARQADSQRPKRPKDKALDSVSIFVLDEF
jgi:hypothetical protein